jgi:hypothetical protein
MTEKEPRENNIVFYNGGGVTPENEVMRIDRQGIKVNPTLSTDEATDAVIRALDGYIKNLAKTEYERGLKEALAKQDQDWSLLEATQESLREHMAMLKELQAKQEQGEPYGWVIGNDFYKVQQFRLEGGAYEDQVAVYTTPQQRTWVGLTDEQILHFVDTHVGAPSIAYPLDNSDWINFARAIEAAHGIKENT